MLTSYQSLQTPQPSSEKLWNEPLTLATLFSSWGPLVPVIGRTKPSSFLALIPKGLFHCEISVCICIWDCAWVIWMYVWATVRCVWSYISVYIVWVCLYVFMYVGVYECVCKCEYIWMCVYERVRWYLSVCVSVLENVWDLCVWVYVCKLKCDCIWVYFVWECVWVFETIYVSGWGLYVTMCVYKCMRLCVCLCSNPLQNFQVLWP